jgi:hypothetical protein
MIFGGQPTVDRYRGNPQGAGARPGLLEDPHRRRRGRSLGAVPRRDGRQRVPEQRTRLHQLLGIWASRHTREIADAIAKRLARSRRCRRIIPTRASPRSPCPASRSDLAVDRRRRAGAGVTDVTAKYRDGAAAREAGRADYLLPTVVHCDSPERGARRRNTCSRSSPSSSARGEDARGDRADARLHARSRATGAAPQAARRRPHRSPELGPVPTIQLNWLQPHEGNLIDFLFRARAFQTAS